MKVGCTLEQKVSILVVDRQAQQGREATTYYSGFMVGESSWV